MDTGKFEEILVRTPFAVHRYGGKTYLTFDSIGKILSMLEPVELEALGDEEINKVLTSGQFNSGNEQKPYVGVSYTANPYQAISQATIRKNQSKGRLFRLKEGKEDGNRNIYQSKGE